MGGFRPSRVGRCRREPHMARRSTRASGARAAHAPPRVHIGSTAQVVALVHPVDAGDPRLRVDRASTSARRAAMTVEASATASVITLAAETLHRRGVPGAGARLRDEHARDDGGRCRGCPHAGTVAPLFPCPLRLIGEAAARLDAHSVATRRGSDDGRR